MPTHEAYEIINAKTGEVLTINNKTSWCDKWRAIEQAKKYTALNFKETKVRKVSYDQ